MHHHSRPHQAGVMPGRSTTDHISATRLLAEKAREFRKDRELFITFIDHKAAFDSVDRDCLWHILHSIGIPPKIVRVLEQLYTDTSSCVRINNTLSDWVTISSGDRQCCMAAPDLFNCIIDYHMEHVSAMVPGIQLGPYHLTDLEYADDAAIFATNQYDILSALAMFDAESCKLGLRTSWVKTKIMKFGDVPFPPSLHICNNDVECVDNSPTWAPSSPTRATFNPILTAALNWRPESCDRSGNHDGTTPPSASKPSSACIRLRYSLSSSKALSAGQFSPACVAG